MSTLVAVYAMKGCVGICDARCYNAMQPTLLKEPRRSACQCICGGANHALGLDRAIKSIARGVGLSPEALQAFAKSRKLNADELVTIDRIRIQSAHRARKLSLELLNPTPLIPGEDLFACEEVTT